MSDLIYNVGLDALKNFETDTFEWLLAQNAYVPDRDHDFIADITNEVTVTSYAREALTGASRVVNNTLNQIVYSCDNPNFGILEDTQSARWLILGRTVTNDADSPLVACFDLGSYGIVLGTTPTSDFIVHLHPDGFAVARQVPQ